MNLPWYLQSSADPTQISLSIESFGKSMAGVITLVAVLKGVDPAIALQTWGNIVSQAVTFATAAYTAYHAAQMIYGIMRKVYLRIFPLPIS